MKGCHLKYLVRSRVMHTLSKAADPVANKHHIKMFGHEAVPSICEYLLAHRKRTLHIN